VAAGISATASKFSHTAGAMMARLAPYKVPLMVASGLVTIPLGSMAVTAGINALPPPVKGPFIEANEKYKQALRGAARSVGQMAANAATSARQAAGDAVASARQTVTGAAASVGQSVDAAATAVKDVAADALGRYADGLERAANVVGPAAATAAGVVLDTVDRPTKRLGVAGLPVALGRGLVAYKVKKALLPVRTATAVTGLATSVVGTIAGRMSRTELARTVTQGKRTLLFFKSQEAVDVWKSSLTEALNRADLLGTPHLTGRGVVASDGIMFEARGTTWHRGTSVVETPSGMRTITHLRNLSLPATHYYFDRRLSDEQAVGIATRQKGFEPEKMPGYVGQVGLTEGLCPAWASTKHAMIKSVLYWGQGGRA
jgi:hypothetical protein